MRLLTDAGRLGGGGSRVVTVPRRPKSAHPSRVRRLIAVATVPMVGVTLWLASTSDHLERPIAAGVYWSYLILASVAVGLYWWTCRPASRIGPLLVVFAALTWVTSWQASNVPLAFDLGVLAEGPFFLLTFYLFLGFPMGRLESRAARCLMGALTVGVVAFFLPWALFTPVIAGGGPLTGCLPACPENVLQIATAPRLVEIAGRAETYAALAITAATFVAFLARLRQASRPQRRSLMAVAVTSLLFLPAYFAFTFAAWILELDPATLETLAWVVVASRILLPVGFLVALVQAERFAFAVQRTLLERLATRPTPGEWRDTIAEAVDDDELQLAYYDPASMSYLGPGGAPLVPPGDDGSRRWVPVDRDGQPVAGMVIDGTLTEDPEFVRAAASATLLAVENGALERELRASRARILEVGHTERRRIERELHDSTQQRLVALRVRLALAGEKVEPGSHRVLLENIGADVEAAIDELREVAHGVYPQSLAHAGLAAAIRVLPRRSSLPVTVHCEIGTRHQEATDTTVYFCLLECLQNAEKHGGPDTSVAIRVTDVRRVLEFSVADDGVGFEPGTVRRGDGLTNLEDRVAAVGGTLRIDSRPGGGTRIHGRLPC